MKFSQVTRLCTAKRVKCHIEHRIAGQCNNKNEALGCPDPSTLASRLSSTESKSITLAWPGTNNWESSCGSTVQSDSSALMHHFCTDGGARGEIDRPTLHFDRALPAPYFPPTRRNPVNCVSRTHSTRNKVNDKDARLLRCFLAACSNLPRARCNSLRRVLAAAKQIYYTYTRIKSRPDCRPESKAAICRRHRSRSKQRSGGARRRRRRHRGEKSLSLVDDALSIPSPSPGPTSCGFSNADFAIKTHCQRQRLPHPSDRRWKACQEAAHPCPLHPSRQPSLLVGGKRVEVSTRARATPQRARSKMHFSGVILMNWQLARM